LAASAMQHEVKHLTSYILGKKLENWFILFFVCLNFYCFVTSCCYRLSAR
jgi:hypothetical protein